MSAGEWYPTVTSGGMADILWLRCPVGNPRLSAEPIYWPTTQTITIAPSYDDLLRRIKALEQELEHLRQPQE